MHATCDTPLLVDLFSMSNCSTVAQPMIGSSVGLQTAGKLTCLHASSIWTTGSNLTAFHEKNIRNSDHHPAFLLLDVFLICQFTKYRARTRASHTPSYAYNPHIKFDEDELAAFHGFMPCRNSGHIKVKQSYDAAEAKAGRS